MSIHYLVFPLLVQSHLNLSIELFVSEGFIFLVLLLTLYAVFKDFFPIDAADSVEDVGVCGYYVAGEEFQVRFFVCCVED